MTKEDWIKELEKVRNRLHELTRIGFDNFYDGWAYVDDVERAINRAIKRAENDEG